MTLLYSAMQKDNVKYNILQNNKIKPINFKLIGFIRVKEHFKSYDVILTKYITYSKNNRTTEISVAII